MDERAISMDDYPSGYGYKGKNGKREIREWEVDDAIRTLCRAKAIEADKELMEKIKPRAAQKLEEVAAMKAEVDRLAGGKS